MKNYTISDTSGVCNGTSDTIKVSFVASRERSEPLVHNSFLHLLLIYTGIYEEVYNFRYIGDSVMIRRNLCRPSYVIF